MTPPHRPRLESPPPSPGRVVIDEEPHEIPRKVIEGEEKPKGKGKRSPERRPAWARGRLRWNPKGRRGKGAGKWKGKEKQVEGQEKAT